MPFPFSGLNSNTQPPQAGQPIVVDLLASPETEPDNANKFGFTEKIGDINDVQGSGKPEVLTPQTLRVEAEASDCVNKSTAGASEQPVVYTSGNLYEMSNSISESSGLEPVILNRNLIETVRDSSMNNAITCSDILTLNDSSNNLIPSLAPASNANFHTENVSSSNNNTTQHFQNDVDSTVNHRAAVLSGNSDTSSSSADKNSDIFGHIANELTTAESKEISLPAEGKECTIKESGSMEAKASNT